MNITPVLADVQGTKRYRLGFQAAEPMRADKLPFGKAFAKSLEQNKKNSFLIIELVEKMVQRKVSVKQFSSPIGIAQASGDAARQQGWTPLLQLMSAISLNLAIFNLFPFPILDGGMILLLAIEGIRRRDISLRLKERIYQLAFVLLVLFAVIDHLQRSGEDVTGIATIAESSKHDRNCQASGEAARQQGWTPLLILMSAISLNLAIFNLFPFPILDGGMILFLAMRESGGATSACV